MRLFLAIQCPPEVKDTLMPKADDVGRYVDMKVVERENMHLTLKFLGDVDSSAVPILVEALTAVEAASFNVQVEGLGAFPNASNARVIWVGIKDGTDVLSLEQKIDSSCQKIGYPADERFHPHITLARVKATVDKQGLIAYLNSNLGTKFGAYHVSSYSLMESKLTSSGPKYFMLHYFPLR